MDDTAPPEPPPHLSDEVSTWWRTVTTEYPIAEWQLPILRAACEAWDRCEGARRQIDEDGLLIADRFGHSKPHPLLPVEDRARTAFVKATRELCLDLSDAPQLPGLESSRLPRRGGSLR